jgi:choice-of-anchor C domain-containing protein
MQNNHWRRRTLATLGTTAAVTGLAVALAAPAGAAAGLANGGFEEPTILNSYRTVPAGESIGLWRVTSGDVDIIYKDFWQPAEADQSLDLSGYARGTIEQTLNTRPGVTYTVTFALSGNPDHQGVVTGRVLAGGKVIKDFAADGTGTTKQAMTYSTETATFTADGRSTTLGFRSTSDVFAVGPVIDRVKIKS